MVASTDIKFYVHTNTNAPQLTNDYGCMIAVLDACLVTGFGSQAVSSITAAGSTATVTFNSAHNFMQYQVIEIAGADQAEYNGLHRILTVPNANSITFELVVAPTITTATGTITCKLPPLGWEKPFGNTGGKAAYRSSNLLLPSRPFLRVVDELDPAYTATYAKYAKVAIVEDMTDIDTMLGIQAPFDSANPTKNWVGSGSGATAINGWSRWYYATATNTSNGNDTTAPTALSRDYILIGNTDYFYIIPVSGTNSASNFYGLVYGFGAFSSHLNIDNMNTFLASTQNYVAANINMWRGQYSGLAGANTGSSKINLLSAYNQALSAITAKCICTGSSIAGSVDSGVSDYILNASSLGYTPLFPVSILEDGSSAIRGEIPNLYWLLQNKPYPHKTIFTEKNNAYIAVLVAAGASYGQMVLKVGDL